MKKRDIITIIVLLVIFAFIFVIALVNKDNSKNDNEDSEFSELTILKDENLFISIEKNINKVFEYATNKPQALTYIIKNNIVDNEYQNKSFKLIESYVISDDSLYKFFIKGDVSQEIINEKPKFFKKEYLILNYDIDKNTYNVEIIDEKKYNKASKEEHIFEKVNINEYNRFEYSTLSPKARAIMYFNDFINKMYSTPELAYNLLSSETKNNYFYTIEEFKNFINKQENFLMNEFAMRENQIGIKDKKNNEYIFEINGILKYEVTINLTGE